MENNIPDEPHQPKQKQKHCNSITTEEDTAQSWDVVKPLRSLI